MAAAVAAARSGGAEAGAGRPLALPRPHGPPARGRSSSPSRPPARPAAAPPPGTGGDLARVAGGMRKFVPAAGEPPPPGGSGRRGAGGEPCPAGEEGWRAGVLPAGPAPPAVPC